MNSSISQKITESRSRLGDRLRILAHHYQDASVIAHADYRGDSLELARSIPDLAAEFIVFCGVRFMAESAATLAKPEQRVFLPASDAECVMARAAPAALAEAILDRLSKDGRRIIPLVYVNSSLQLKALCGKKGGATCTSANAEAMLRWAGDRGDAVLFLPDKNLGQNTAYSLGWPTHEQAILDITRNGNNLDLKRASSARLLLWPACCPIHAHFQVTHISELRKKYLGLIVIVHPECRPEVVKAADAVGSTSFIIRYVEQAAPGSTIAIGTEINLVERLAQKFAPEKTIVPLSKSLCRNMAKVNSALLSELLANLLRSPESVPEIQVEKDCADIARLALERMLQGAT